MTEMARENTVIFREVQRFALWLRLALLVFTFFMIGLCWFALRDISSQQGSIGALPVAFFIVFMVFVPAAVAVLFLTLKLETEVRSDGLYVRFFPFHIRYKEFTAEDLTECCARTYRPILEYGGWGIRFGKKGKAYNVKGNKAVQLTLKNQKRLLIGSQKPDELARAIGSFMKTV